MDICPTILAMFGIPPSEDMDGRVLRTVFTPEFATRLPTKKVPPYEQLFPEERSRKDTVTVIERDLMDRLKALGYIK